MTSMKTKEKALANAKSKPDPREEAPAIHAEILEMQGQICTQVGLREERTPVVVGVLMAVAQ
jgi:hypothetical protein